MSDYTEHANADSQELIEREPMRRGLDEPVISELQGVAHSKEGSSYRLSVDLTSSAARSLEAYADRHGVNITEAVRRAIATLTYIDRAGDAGLRIQNADLGRVNELTFLSE